MGALPTLALASTTCMNKENATNYETEPVETAATFAMPRLAHAAMAISLVVVESNLK